MNEPKIRFKGFCGEWNASWLGDVAPLVGGYAFQSNQFASEGISIVRISNILDTGIVGGEFAKYKVFCGDDNFRLYDGDAVIAMSGATTGKVATIRTNNYLYQNQRVGKFSKTDKVEYDLLTEIVKSQRFHTALARLLTSSAQPNASSRDIDSISQYFPKEREEQKALASFFTSLDAQISASTSRLAALKQVKAASLQAMFPQEGETVPKVRFKGFRGEWKKVKLGECVKILRGIRVTREQLKQDGCYPVYQNTNYPLGYFDKYNVESHNPFVILGGSAGLVGFSNSKFWAADDCAFFSDSNGVDKYWLYCILQLHKSFIEKNVRGSSVPRLERSALCNLEVKLPSLSEQQQIASFFTTLDLQITLQSQRLEKLKQIKAACLDKMFV